MEDENDLENEVAIEKEELSKFQNLGIEVIDKKTLENDLENEEFTE